MPKTVGIDQKWATAVALALVTVPVVAQERSYTLLEREIEYLHELMPGEYDNWQQLNIERAWEGPDAEPRNRYHVEIAAEGDSEQDGHALSVMFETPNDGQEAQRTTVVYSLIPDEAARAVRALAYTPAGAEGDLRVEACDLELRRDLFSFVGSTASADCEGLPTRLRVEADRLAWQIGGEDSGWRRMRRAKRFACMIDVPKNEPRTANHTQHYVEIHDQGDSFDFLHPDGRNMQLLLGYDWSYGMRRDTFFVAVLDMEENGRTLVYGWGEPGADRIGVNPGWIRVQCDVATEENRKMQHGLRPDS